MTNEIHARPKLCARCGEPVAAEVIAERGAARFCSTRCKKAAHQWAQRKRQRACAMEAQALALRQDADRFHDSADLIEAQARRVRAAVNDGPMHLHGTAR